jgi:hypothetical protein
MSNTEQFAAVLAENFIGVQYDKTKNRGTATIPNVGTINFREAGNEPSVIVELVLTKRFKGSAETALDFIEKIHTAWGNSD